MLLIEQSQVDALKQTLSARFELQMLEHVQTYFPNHCRIAGNQAIKQLVTHGMVQAQSYGFVTQRDCCLYLTSMFMLGTHFDVDPMYPWVTAYMDPESSDQHSDRACELADKSLAFLQSYAGKERRYINKCMLYLHAKPNNLVLTFKHELHAYEAQIVQHLKDVFPNKVAIIGEHEISQLISNGLLMATKYGISESIGQSLLTTMMLLLGSSIDNDPFIPWVKEILNDKSIDSQSVRVSTLQDRCIYFIEQWLSKPNVV